MTLFEVGAEYLSQSEDLKARIAGLRPLLEIYRGDDLNQLKHRIWLLYDMARECRKLGRHLQMYYRKTGEGLA